MFEKKSTEFFIDFKISEVNVSPQLKTKGIVWIKNNYRSEKSACYLEGSARWRSRQNCQFYVLCKHFLTIKVRKLTIIRIIFCKIWSSANYTWKSKKIMPNWKRAKKLDICFFFATWPLVPNIHWFKADLIISYFPT